MTTIGYNDIENVLLSLTDPNTWWAISNVPWVSSPKINATTSIYNEQGWGWDWIAWWSTNVNWYASDYNTVSWGSGSVYLPDWTELTISSGNTGNMSTVTYIYYDQSDSLVHTTTSAWASVWEDKILLCVAAPTTSWKDATFQAFGTDKQSTFITADNIAADSITANEIQSNSIETRHLDSYAVTADKMYVSELSAISADLWNITAWTITGTTITASDWTSKITLDPYDWEIAIYRNNSYVWAIKWNNESWVWNCVGITWTNVAVTWKLWCLGRLRIPVWSDLY